MLVCLAAHVQCSCQPLLPRQPNQMHVTLRGRVITFDAVNSEFTACLVRSFSHLRFRAERGRHRQRLVQTRNFF